MNLLLNLKHTFFENKHFVNKNNKILTELWNNIVEKYGEKHRFYHNLSHISQIFFQFENIKDKISDFPTLTISAFYHDIFITQKEMITKKLVFLK